MLNAQTLFWFACGLIGAAVAVLVLVVRSALDRSAESAVDPDRYDVARLADLRQVSLIVRLFEPLVHGLGGVMRCSAT